MVIKANHLMRTALTAMRRTAQIAKTSTRSTSDASSASPVFRIQGEDELEQAEKLYLPGSQPAKALILAASQGKGWDR